MHKKEEIDYSQPVAYDTNGRPLYAHPPKDHGPTEKQKKALQHAVHYMRSAEPEKPEISDRVQKKHEDSVKKYPWLNLTEGEYVIKNVHRHPIGLYTPCIIGGLMVLLTIWGVANYQSLTSIGNPSFGNLLLVAVAAIGLICLGVYIAVNVYLRSRLILTNESIIQETQHTLFSHHEQTVSLANVEDVSYTRHGAMQMFFNYGTVRLSTEGEETTYIFHYVDNPKVQTAQLHNAVEAFKNGRPIPEDD